MSEDSAGGPLNSTKPLVLMIYDFAFDEYKLGRASALTVILFLLAFICKSFTIMVHAGIK